MLEHPFSMWTPRKFRLKKKKGAKAPFFFMVPCFYSLATADLSASVLSVFSHGNPSRPKCP